MNSQDQTPGRQCLKIATATAAINISADTTTPPTQGEATPIAAATTVGISDTTQGSTKGSHIVLSRSLHGSASSEKVVGGYCKRYPAGTPAKARPCI